MKNLLNELKTAFNGLAYADLGEMHTHEQKSQALLTMPEATALQQRMAANSTVAPNRHIVLAIDGQLQAAAVKYALNTCQRMEAALVVLCTGSHADAERALVPHQDTLTESGLSYRIVTQRGSLQEAVAKYHRKETGILLVVAGSGDEVHSETAHNARSRNTAWRLNFPLVVVMDPV